MVSEDPSPRGFWSVVPNVLIGVIIFTQTFNCTLNLYYFHRIVILSILYSTQFNGTSAIFIICIEFNYANL